MSVGHDATTPATSGEEESKRKGEHASREFEENAKGVVVVVVVPWTRHYATRVAFV